MAGTSDSDEKRVISRQVRKYLKMLAAFGQALRRPAVGAPWLIREDLAMFERCPLSSRSRLELTGLHRFHVPCELPMELRKIDGFAERTSHHFDLRQTADLSKKFKPIPPKSDV
jgi:hypothetical protein